MEKTPDEILNATILELSQDPEIAPYLGYVVVPIQMVPAAKTVEYIERVIAAFNRAKGVSNEPNATSPPV